MSLVLSALVIYLLRRIVQKEKSIKDSYDARDKIVERVEAAVSKMTEAANETNKQMAVWNELLRNRP